MLKTLLPQNRFARAVSVLVGGTAGAQLIVIAASPILTRLYTPDDFGLLAVYGAILGILSVIASLRYQLAIPVPESEEQAASIVILSLLIVCVTTLCSALVLWLFGEQLIRLLNMPAIRSYLWVIPLGLFLIGLYDVFQYWAIRTKAFSNITKTRLTQSIGMVIVQIGGHALGPAALLAGRVIGQSFGVFGLGKSALTASKTSFRNVNKESIKSVARAYKNFPIIGTWTGLTNSAATNLPPLLIAAFLGAASAGLFSLAHRVLSQPTAIIGKAVSDAFYQRAVEANREGGLGEAVKSVYSTLVKLALAPAMTIFLVMPDVFIIVFGDSWAAAGEIARWMTPWLFFQFVVSPCTGIYPIIDRHDIALRFQLSLLLASLIGAVVGGLYLKDLVWAVLIISALSSLIYLWRAATTFSVVGLNWVAALWLIIESMPLSLIINIPVFLALMVDDSNLLWLSVSVFCSALLWLGFLAVPMERKSKYIE